MYSQAELTAHVRDLGVREGETLLVQSSVKAIGPVDGGSAAIVAALRAALGPAGTLVAYTATPENSDTSPLDRAATAGLPPAELRGYRATMPAFDRASTPASRTMGRLAEEIRTTEHAVRSDHPQTSFAAVGPAAGRLMAGHDLRSHLGERSPTHRLYQEGARVLLVSVPWVCCTVFHLAEYWQPEQAQQHYGCVIRDGRGVRQWVHFDALRLEVRHFEEMAQAVVRECAGLVRGRLGDAECFLLPIAETVDLATKWLLNRKS